MRIYYRSRTGTFLLVDIKQIRRIKLIKLIQEVGKGSKARLARKLGSSPAYLTQLLSLKTKADMGDKFARNAEDKLKLGHGWMDVLDEREHEMLSAENVERALRIATMDEKSRAALDVMIESLSSIKPQKKH